MQLLEKRFAWRSAKKYCFRESEIIKMRYLNNKEEFSFLSAASLGFRLILCGKTFSILPHHSLSANQCQPLHTDSQSPSKLALFSYYPAFFTSSLCCSQWSRANILENHSVSISKMKIKSLCSVSEQATTNDTKSNLPTKYLTCIFSLRKHDT